MFETRNASLNAQHRCCNALAQRMMVLIVLLAVALLTTSCGMPAQAAGLQAAPANDLSVRGPLPLGKVNESYNAVLAVNGGNVPYHFSVKTGVSPPASR